MKNAEKSPPGLIDRLNVQLNPCVLVHVKLTSLIYFQMTF